MKKLVLGTAGHVDHGKTRLVHALTGVDTDRLAEEKERGITIDLGFARLVGADDVQVAVVDVPGHESFIRNMIAGATGMDAVLLVVAADEGVMPQTREHVAILELLGVRHGVVALTKVDLVDAEWRALVHEDIRSHLRGTGLEDAPVVEVSAVSGEGLAALGQALGAVALRTPGRSAHEQFRLPIDRVFTVRGTGTVVTGTVADGVLAGGDDVVLLPGGVHGRVRALQVHGEEVDRVEPGQRAAVAVTGLDRAAAKRGDVLVTGESWRPHGTWTVRLSVLGDAPRALRTRERVRVHAGTDEIMARVRLLDDEALPPGGEAWAQLRLERPGVARAGDRFVLRTYSPMTTVAGGVVAEPFARKRRRLDEGARRLLEGLLGTPAEALRARLAIGGWEGVAERALPVEVPGARMPDDGSVLRAGNRWVAAALRDEAAKRVVAAVDAVHDAAPLEPGIDMAEARRAIPGHAAPGLADLAIERLVAEGVLVAEAGRLRRAGYAPRLDRSQLRLRERVVAAYREGGLAPTPVAEAVPEGEDAWPIVKMLEREGLLRPLGPDAYVDAAALRSATELVRSRMGGRSGVQPAEFRDLLGLSRKHLIPLLEHFDRVGITRREGEGRSVQGDG